MKRMVDRLMIRREELSKKRKELEKSGNGADFGNTILTSKEARARDSDLAEGTIVQKSSAATASEPEPSATIQEVPRMNPYRMAAAGARVQPIPPPVSEHATHLPVTPVSLQNRSQFFPQGSSVPSLASQGVSSISSQGMSSISSHLPVTHLQLGSSTKPQSEVQRIVLNLMPAVSGQQPVHGRRGTEWMKWRRRGEELRQQFGNDFQVLYDTYYAELQRVNDQMRAIENSPN